MSHRLANYHLALQRLGYETAHIGKWHMGNDAAPRPGYDHWVSFRGQGTIVDPVFFEEGSEKKVPGYVTDLLNERAAAFVVRKRRHPFALFLAHKAVHPDVQQKQDGTIDLASMRGYLLPERHENLYRDGVYPPRPNVLPLEKILKQKPAWKDVFDLRAKPLRPTPWISPVHLPASLRGPIAFDDLRRKPAFQGLPGAYSDLSCRGAYPAMTTLPCASSPGI